LQGLRVLYQRTGRDTEWARLVSEITPDFTDPAPGGALPGREEHWDVVTSYRARLAEDARDWSVASTLQDALTARHRNQAAMALTVPAESLTPDQRVQIRNLAVDLADLGDILREQDDPSCVPRYQEALALFQRIGDRPGEADKTQRLGYAFLLSALRNLDQAEHWFQYSLSLRPENDRLGRARNLASLAQVAQQRFSSARAAGTAVPRSFWGLNHDPWRCCDVIMSGVAAGRR
jgi:tetratricopeptide (TPR) repeat protein